MILYKNRHDNNISGYNLINRMWDNNFSEGKTVNTFEQFASVDDVIVPFSTGTYQLENGGDFLYGLDESDFGEITINRTKKYAAGKGMTDHSSSHTYELNSLGFVQVAVVKH